MTPVTKPDPGAALVGLSRRPRGRLLAAALAPLAVAALACSGVSDVERLGDTGGPEPLVVATEQAVGSGDGAAPAARGSTRRRAAGKAGREKAADGGDDKPTPGPEKAEPEGKRGITQTGPRSWTVKQRLVDRWQDDPYALASVEAHGEGWMLHRVRKRDAFHLGMKNKDVILSVNGRKLKTKAQLLAAYLALKNKKDFEVVFKRKGKQMTHHYHIKG